jgi:hypothetical protein
MQRYAGRHLTELKKFDWTLTRHTILTVDPSQFVNGRDAWEHINHHKIIPGLIRNLERGKKQLDQKSGKWKWAYQPIKIKNWKWFLEWHKNGFPHLHLFLEVEKKGKAGMIGGDRLRYYWSLGRVIEGYFKSTRHWMNTTGYFKKHGYFCQKQKKHQIRLPKWAINEAGLKMRRSGAKITAKKKKNNVIELAEYFSKRGEIIDTTTGEIKNFRPKRKYKQRSYSAIFASCGKRSRVKIMTPHTAIKGLFDIPYRELREKIPGHFLEKTGYSFQLTGEIVDWLMDHVVYIEYFKGAYVPQEIKARIESWYDFRVEQGYFVYSRAYNHG